MYMTLQDQDSDNEPQKTKKSTKKKKYIVYTAKTFNFPFNFEPKDINMVEDNYKHKTVIY